MSYVHYCFCLLLVLIAPPWKQDDAIREANLFIIYCIYSVFISKWIFLGCYWKCKRELQVQVIGFCQFSWLLYVFSQNMLSLLFTNLFFTTTWKRYCSFLCRKTLYLQFNKRKKVSNNQIQNTYSRYFIIPSFHYKTIPKWFLWYSTYWRNHT